MGYFMGIVFLIAPIDGLNRRLPYLADAQGEGDIAKMEWDGVQDGDGKAQDPGDVRPFD